jgi:chromosome partitioning protein
VGKILTVATLKGGSGKSTFAACLSVYWHLNGFKTVLIDADPQSSVARIGEREEELGGLPVLTVSPRGLDDKIAKLAGEYDYVITDTAGFKNPATIAAISVADHVLIPIKPSPLDSTLRATLPLWCSKFQSRPAGARR